VIAAFVPAATWAGPLIVIPEWISTRLGVASAHTTAEHSKLIAAVFEALFWGIRGDGAPPIGYGNISASVNDYLFH